MYPVFAENTYQVLPTDKGTLNVGLSTIPPELHTGDTAKLQIDFLNPKTNNIQEHIDYKVTVTRDGENVFGPIPLTHTSTGSVKIPVEVQKAGDYSALVEVEGVLFQPIPPETVSFQFTVSEPQVVNTGQQKNGGGCLIATATYGSELAPQVQFLREIRDNTVLGTQSGTAFMSAFNSIYYSFSPTVADWERENPVFKEMVKVAITPLLSSLSLLQYVDINSESDLLVSGIGIILLNFGMYFVVPAFAVIKFCQFKRKSNH